MGGTSTDVSRFAEGKYEHVVESTTAGVTIQAPQLDINTGSIIKNKLFSSNVKKIWFRYFSCCRWRFDAIFPFWIICCWSWVCIRSFEWIDNIKQLRHFNKFTILMKISLNNETHLILYTSSSWSGMLSKRRPINCNRCKFNSRTIITRIFSKDFRSKWKWAAGLCNH